MGTQRNYQFDIAGPQDALPSMEQVVSHFETVFEIAGPLDTLPSMEQVVSHFTRCVANESHAT